MQSVAELRHPGKHGTEGRQRELLKSCTPAGSLKALPKKGACGVLQKKESAAGGNTMTEPQASFAEAGAMPS